MVRSSLVRTIFVLAFGIGLIFWWVLPLRAAEFPQPEGFVNDFAQLLSPAFRQELETKLQNFEKETGIEIAVVTIESLEGNSLEDYAVRLFEDWRIGKKGADNGLLLLIAEKERQIRIEVGYGLEPIITDGRAGRIIREKMRPAFRQGNYDRGVRLATEQLEAYLRSGQPPTGKEVLEEKTQSNFYLFIGGLFFLVYLASFWGRSKRFWPGGVIGALVGGLIGWLMGKLLTIVFLALGFGLFGLFLDYFLSKNYQKLKKAGRSTGFWSSRGGFFSGGGSSGRSFGGFGGGSSGGGGASGGW